MGYSGSLVIVEEGDFSFTVRVVGVFFFCSIGFFRLVRGLFGLWIWTVFDLCFRVWFVFFRFFRLFCFSFVFGFFWVFWELV